MSTQNPDIECQLWDTLTGLQDGALDISASKDFPLALSFTIKDIMDITKSKGSYSKTFKIPATEQNNKVLLNIFADGFYDVFNFIENKTVKIFFNSQLIISGGFKIKATVIDSKPLEYECVIFGENFKWVNELDRLNLCDIDWEAGGMFSAYPSVAERTRETVEETWKYSYSDTLRSGVGTHFVYPVINRGKWNNPNRVAFDELLPTWWVRNMVYQILASAGYTLVSNFMDSTWFKQLVTLFPLDDNAWIPEEEIIQDASFSFDIIGPSPWKIPVDYREANIGNRFDGAITYDLLGFVGPSFNNGNLITQINPIFPHACSPGTKYYWDVTGAHGNPDLTGGRNAISGWFWGCYGGITQLNNGAYFNRFDPPVNCSSAPNWNSYGHDWEEVWTWSSGYCPNVIPTIDNVHTEALDEIAVFKGDTLNEYTLNFQVELEMDNSYVYDNVPEPYDCAFLTGLLGGGFAYGNGWWYDDPAYGYGWETSGVYFVGTLWIVWVHKVAKYSEFILVDNYTYSHPSAGNGYWGMSMSQLPASPGGNLTFKLEAENLIIDVSDVEDEYYFYTEVNEKFIEIDGFSGEGLLSWTQCKYRINGGYIDGGLVGAVVSEVITTVPISNLLPCDNSQLDFINGLTGVFNLYWRSDEENKIIYCEPRDDFFFPRTQAVDWSDKLDFGQKQTSKFIYDALNRDLCFTYEDDGADGFVEERNSLVDQVCSLNSYAMDLGTLYKDKESKIGTNYFSPSYQFRDKTIGNNQGKSPLITVIHSEYTLIWNELDSNFFPDKVVDFAPRILLWTSLIPLNKQDGAITGNEWRWCKDNQALWELKKNIPSALSFYDEDELQFGSLQVGGDTLYPTLPYNNVEANRVQPAPILPATYPLCQGLYDVFYERSIENLIQRPRLKKAKFYLEANDIAQLDLRKLVYLRTGTEDTYWIINRITDYKPGQNQLTTVELYQFIPARPVKGRGKGKYIQNNEINGQTKDYVINYSGGKNNVHKLGTNGIVRQGNGTKQHLSGVTPRNENTKAARNFEINKASPVPLPVWRSSTNGSTLNTLPNSNPGVNIGYDNDVQQNSGTVALGRNLKNLNPNKIYIGYGSVPLGNTSPIQIMSGQKNPALAIDNNGNVLEGGGGSIMAKDINGVYFEVLSDREFFGDITVRKILKANNR
tara:strand:+ start:10381 stop:13860 length:3480 start_codon:yes stop_codon:yes gene_type:complete